MRLRVTAAVPPLLILISCGDHGASTPPRATQSPQPNLSADAAHERAVALQRLGRHIESVPLFRRALEAHQAVSRLHLEYGEALHNASFQTDLRFGFVRYVVPSSQERIALANEGIMELHRAVGLAQAADERAYALFILGRSQSLLGLQPDALESITMARALAPNVPVLKDLEVSLRAILTEGGAASAGRLQDDAPRSTVSDGRSPR